MNWSQRMIEAIQEFQAREQMGLRNSRLARYMDHPLMARCRKAIKYLRRRNRRK